jgi:hypothetical protein
VDQSLVVLEMRSKLLARGANRIHCTICTSADKVSIGHIKLIRLSKTESTEEIASLQELMEKQGSYSCSEFLYQLSSSDEANSLASPALGSVYFIDQVYIEPAFRGLLYGDSALQLLLQRLKPEGSQFVLEACPGIDGREYALITDADVRVEKMSKDTIKLKTWYARHGFHELPFGEFMYLK